MIWNRVPFLRILLPFLIGIGCAALVDLSSMLTLVLAGALFLLLGLVSYLKLDILSFKYQWIYGILLNIVLFTFGYLLAISQSDLTDDIHYSKYLDEGEQGALIEILKPINQKPNSVQAEVGVLQISIEGGWRRTVSY